MAEERHLTMIRWSGEIKIKLLFYVRLANTFFYCGILSHSPLPVPKFIKGPSLHIVQIALYDEMHLITRKIT